MTGKTRAVDESPGTRLSDATTAPGTKRLSLRDCLNLYVEARPLARADQEALLYSRCSASDDERAMLTYALASLSAEAGGALHRLLDALVARAAAAAPNPPEIAPDEWRVLLKAFDEAPAQLHPALLGFFDAHRGATALALCLAPRACVEPIMPVLLPLLLDPSAERAADVALRILDDAEAVAPVLSAFQQLSLSAHAAVASELPPASMALCLVASSPRFTDSSSLGPTWRVLEALADARCPSEEQLTMLHATLMLLSRSHSSRLSRCIGEAGALLEAAPHLPCLRWLGLVTSMKTSNGRLSIHHSWISRALLAAETRSIGRTFVQHPEQRSMIGFICGWFLLLVAFFGALEEIAKGQLLHLMLDLYVLASAVLTCVLELEINSPLIRDHIALPIERSLAFLRLASGRGVLYCAAGLLAIDISARETAGNMSIQAISGSMMLLFGGANLALGSLVAVKLKRLRRSLTGPQALRTAYRTALGADAAEAQGLNAAAAKRFFDSLGMQRMGRYQLQAVFLEIDGPRRGLLTEASLLVWYHGHIGRHLKRLINETPPAHRSLRKWLLTWPSTALDLSVWATFACLLMLPASIVAAVTALAQRSLLQLVINLYLSVLAVLMLVIEVKEPRYLRKTSLHLLRYASTMMHPTARGTLYLLLSLALLTQDAEATPSLWIVGYVVEFIGILHVLVGARVASKVRALKKALPDNRAILAAYRAVSPDRLPISDFGLKLLCQSAGVKLSWRFEQVALVGLLDLDRDGSVTEEDLIYWLGAEDEEALEEAEEEAETGAAAGEAEAEGGGGGGGLAASTPVAAAAVAAACGSEAVATAAAAGVRTAGDAALEAALRSDAAGEMEAAQEGMTPALADPVVAAPAVPVAPAPALPSRAAPREEVFLNVSAFVVEPAPSEDQLESPEPTSPTEEGAAASYFDRELDEEEIVD